MSACTTPSLAFPPAGRRRAPGAASGSRSVIRRTIAGVRTTDAEGRKACRRTSLAAFRSSPRSPATRARQRTAEMGRRAWTEAPICPLKGWTRPRRRTPVSASGAATEPARPEDLAAHGSPGCLIAPLPAKPARARVLVLRTPLLATDETDNEATIRSSTTAPERTTVRRMWKPLGASEAGVVSQGAVYG